MVYSGLLYYILIFFSFVKINNVLDTAHTLLSKIQ